MGNEPLQTGHWIERLDDRERAQVVHARDYAAHYPNAGAPGHGQFLLIAKLAQLLDDREPHEND